MTEPRCGYIGSDSAGAVGAIALGCSLGAYHALQLALQRADLFPVAICLSGNYDPSTWHGWGERGDAAYFTNPTDYVPQLHGDHLEWLRSRLQSCSPSGRAPGRPTRRAHCPVPGGWPGCCGARGISHELDVWGHDVAHDWPWWRRQIAHHLPRFC